MSKIEYEKVSFFDLLDDNSIEVEVPRKSFKRNFSNVIQGISLSIIAGVVVSLLILLPLTGIAFASAPITKAWRDLPSDLSNTSISEKNIMYDANGDIFAEVWSENRTALGNIDEISLYARQALVDTEDKRFYEHKGFDVIGTARSAITGSGGGSGITQQLVKNIQFYDQIGKDKKEQAIEASYSRKIKELKYALDYEKEHSKDEILLEYFNTVAFGSPNIYSIESASQYFFGKSAKDLDLAESAVLVGSVQNPVVFNVNDDSVKDLWKERQWMVLQRMVSENHITSDEAKKAYEQELNLKRSNNSGGSCAYSEYPSYCEYVLKYLSDSPRFGETIEERKALLDKGGLHIKTYLTPEVMTAIDKRLEADFGNDNRAVAPVAVTQPSTGGVLGMGVNRDYGVNPGETTINVPLNPAATGSTYKMFALASALENGFTEQSLTFGSSCPYNNSAFDTPPGGFKNSLGCGGFQSGILNYKQATAWSSNTWFLQLAGQTGLEPVIDLSKKMNLNVPDTISSRSASFILGSVENSPVNMASAYATFANEGVYCPATPVISYAYADGSTPAIPDNYNPESISCKRVMTPYTASVVLKAMRANTYPGEVRDAFGTDAQITNYDAVGKSGTNETYNLTWGQVSKDYSLFINIYDMDNLTNGVLGNIYYKGTMPSLSPVVQAGSDVLRDITRGKPNKPLNYNSIDTSWSEVPIETRDFFTIPNVTGMEPQKALKTMESIGITAHISKDIKETPQGYPNGIILEQSLEAGLQLPVGTKKEIILYQGN